MPKDAPCSGLRDWLGTLDKSNVFYFLAGVGNHFCGSSISLDDSTEEAFFSFRANLTFG
jgi:hypothetical protein